MASLPAGPPPPGVAAVIVEDSKKAKLFLDKGVFEVKSGASIPMNESTSFAVYFEGIIFFFKKKF